MTTVTNSPASPAEPTHRAAVPAWKRVLTNNWSARALFYLTMLLLWIVMSALLERFPGPVRTAQALYFEFSRGEVIGNFALTMGRFLIALLISCVLGITIGLLIGLSRWWRYALEDLVLVGLTLPAILWAFLTIVWYGFDSRAQILAAVLTTVPFIIMNVSKGVGGISRNLRDMAQSYGVPPLRRVRHLIVPAVYGYLIVGTRIGAVVAWNVVLLSEWFGSNTGIGFRSRYWYDANDYSGFLGWAILFVLILIILDLGLLAPMERRAFRWRDGDSRLNQDTLTTPAATASGKAV